MVPFLTSGCDRKLVLGVDPSAENRKLAFLTGRIVLKW